MQGYGIVTEINMLSIGDISYNFLANLKAVLEIIFQQPETLINHSLLFFALIFYTNS